MLHLIPKAACGQLHASDKHRKKREGFNAALIRGKDKKIPTNDDTCV
jgi:hypothetical protein